VIFRATSQHLNKYATELPVLREDRNVCDYDHTAVVGDLVFAPAAAEALAVSMLTDSKVYLTSRGLTL
jgi:hypothetical protein